VHTGFRWGKMMETDHLEHTGIGEGIILKWILKKWVEGQDQWQAFVDVVMNLQVP